MSGDAISAPKEPSVSGFACCRPPIGAESTPVGRVNPISRRSRPSRDRQRAQFSHSFAVLKRDYPQYQRKVLPFKLAAAIWGECKGRVAASPPMETLYDLLGALPRDDAEELRAAFRRAVKGAHPDLNPGDPDAGEKFREILRANEILGDEEQRAAYDHLLGLAHREQSQQATARTMYKLATSMLVLVIVAAGGVGGYLTHQNMPEISGRLKQIAAIATASPTDFADLTPAPAGTMLQQNASSDEGRKLQ